DAPADHRLEHEAHARGGRRLRHGLVVGLAGLFAIGAVADQGGVARGRRGAHVARHELCSHREPGGEASQVHGLPSWLPQALGAGLSVLTRSSHSNTAMPATMAATNTRPLTSPEAMDTRPGPGQKPARPQPAPKVRLPMTRRLSMDVALGRCMAPPRKLRVRCLASA